MDDRTNTQIPPRPRYEVGDRVFYGPLGVGTVKSVTAGCWSRSAESWTQPFYIVVFDGDRHIYGFDERALTPAPTA